MNTLRTWIFGLVAAVAVHAGLLAAILTKQDDGLAEADTGGAFDTVLTLTLNDGADTGTKGGDADRIAGPETEADTPLQAPSDREVERAPEAEADKPRPEQPPSTVSLDPAPLDQAGAPMPGPEVSQGDAPEAAQPDPARTAEQADPLPDESADKPQTGQPSFASQLETDVHSTGVLSALRPNKDQTAAGKTTATQAPNKTVPIVEHAVEVTSQSMLAPPKQQSEQVDSNPGEALSEPPHAPNPAGDAKTSADLKTKAVPVVSPSAPDIHYEARRAAAEEAHQKAAAERKRKTAQSRQQGDSRKTTKRGNAAQGTSAAARAAQGDHKSYARTLRQWVERHKRYPVKARDRGITGRGTLKITIARSGKVLSSSLVKSTGDGTLDAALKALPKRASPFPQMPIGLPGSRLTFSVPVSFRK